MGINLVSLLREKTIGYHKVFTVVFHMIQTIYYTIEKQLQVALNGHFFCKLIMDTLGSTFYPKMLRVFRYIFIAVLI